MRPTHWRRHVLRRARFESIELRLLMSGNPAGDFFAEYFVEDQLYEEVQTALVDAHELTGLTEARSDYGFTGQGQTVVVVDTGIAYDHPALGGGFGVGYRVVGGFDFAEDPDADPYDDGPLGSHGTHVAGIIGSSDSTCPGVAPDVDLVALRVFNDSGAGYFDWVEEALRWVHDHRDTFQSPITTVNLSLGSDWNSDVPPPWAMLEDELAQLKTDGIFVSVAAGNDFTTYGEPGLNYPAASTFVVPVSAVDDDGRISYFSQRHERVIAAPGRGILSTVPDYVGNHNGIDDDFARYSGTSMAAPYVAGASALLREALEFVGEVNVTQDTIYDLMRSTADVIYDTATNQSYHRLNLRRALDWIMPDDDFGSSAATAYDLGTLVDGQSISGTIGQLDDHDFFSFTAARTGRIAFSLDVTHQMRPEWELAGEGYAAQGTGGSFSFDVNAGQTYTVGLGTAGGVGHYTMDVTVHPDVSSPEGKTVRQEELLDNRISAEGDWFCFTAGQQGILTAEAFFSNSAGDVDLQLVDGNGQLLGGSYSMGDYERIDVTVAAGDSFYLHAYVNGTGVNEDVDLRITNLVAQVGESVNVLGTDGDDLFTFTAGNTRQLTINGVRYEFPSDLVSSVNFDGLAGSDTAILNGTTTDDVAVLRAGSADLSGSGYAVYATNVETVTARGNGGSDSAWLYDSPGDDHFLATPEEAQLYGPGFSNSVVGFETVHAYATAGGLDVAKLYDSAGDDVFIATPIYGKLYGEGFSRRAKFFDAVHAYGTAGGHDMAILRDSGGDDVFIGTPVYGKLYGNGFMNRAKFFEEVSAWATAGGYDTAYLQDSPGDDTLIVRENETTLCGQEFMNRAAFFDEVHTWPSAGGNDQAYFYASAIDDLLKTAANTGSVSDITLAAWLYGFDQQAAGRGQWAAGSSQWAAGSGQWRESRTLNSEPWPLTPGF